jgi:hypothetical protein
MVSNFLPELASNHIPSNLRLQVVKITSMSHNTQPTIWPCIEKVCGSLPQRIHRKFLQINGNWRITQEKNEQTI